MEKFKFLDKRKIDNLPKNSGVYAFKSNEGLLYIGKATNIQNRVKNHFQQPTYKDSGFIGKIQRIGFFQTVGEVEALILESQLIRKYQPKFNVIWKDDKNYFYAAISGGPTPVVSITHQAIRGGPTPVITKYIGPFTDGRALKKALQLLRKIFPYYSAKNHSEKMCPYCHLKLCPGPNPELNDYQKNINNLIAVLEGKKQKVLKNLKKEMILLSKLKNFEKAAKLRDKFLALEKTISNAKIFEKQNNLTFDWKKTNQFLQDLLKTDKKIKRIEGYDISNIQGKQATASMVVFINGEADKDQYRKFKIHPIKYREAVISPSGKLFNRVKITGKPNDTAMIKETLQRRFSHPEWQEPDLILIDGGKPQLSAAVSSVKPDVLVMALAKRNNELFVKGKKDPYLLNNMAREVFNLILQIRDESHRFALAYHKKMRERELLTY